jgi:hypothetical protein
MYKFRESAQQKRNENQQKLGLITTTTGKRNDARPPAGNEKSPFGTDHPVVTPLVLAFEESRFISDTFFTFFSCTYSR